MKKKLDKEEMRAINASNLKTLKRASPGFIKTLLIIIVIIIFHPPFWMIALGFLVLNAAWMIYKNNKPMHILKSEGVLLLYLIFLHNLNTWFGAWGWIGYALTVIIIAGIIIWKRWAFFIKGKHTIERMIWGETLREQYERRQEEKARTRH